MRLSPRDYCSAEGGPAPDRDANCTAALCLWLRALAHYAVAANHWINSGHFKTGKKHDDTKDPIPEP